MKRSSLFHWPPFRWLLAHWPKLVGISLLLASLTVLYQTLQKYSIHELGMAVKAIPQQHLWEAIGLTALNYLVMTGYDTLAVRSLQRSLPFTKTAFTAIVSYGISNAIGLALLSSSAIRYRIYHRDLLPLQIAKLILFCQVSFWLGLFAIAGLIFVLQPIKIPTPIHLFFPSAYPFGFVFLAIVLGYLGWNLFSHEALALGQWVLPHLPLRLCLGQITIAASDWLLAAAVLYLLLPSAQLSFTSFFAIYLLAQIAGIVSNVPGGLGVFETVMLLMLSPTLSSAALLGALLAYRGIYYLLPLWCGLALLGWYEFKTPRCENLPKL